MNQASDLDGLGNLRKLAEKFANANLPEDKEIPIVMGFSGWGTPLFGAINYWGGIENTPKLLMESGYTVIVTPIGPLSSNWERACELYIQLTSGRFDYFNPDTNDIEAVQDVPGLEISYGAYFTNSANGPNESTTTGRKRAIIFTESQDKYVNWKWGNDHRVHFICHSQGGNTVRYLLSMMATGNSLHPTYFGELGRDNWAISVTTIGTPHKGTTIIDVIENLVPNETERATKLLARLFAIASFSTPKLRAYDLQLDHWGICRRPGESFQETRQRFELNNGPVVRWLRSKHNAFYDNSIKGVNDLHLKAISTSEQVYYFSLSFHATIPFPTEWPSWTNQTIDSFPVSLVDFMRKVLNTVPLLNFGGGLQYILDAIVQNTGWAVIASLSGIKDLVKWATVQVANPLLRQINYNITLPSPGKYLPRNDVFPLMLPTVYAMGSRGLTAEQIGILGPHLGDWFLNDGIVNTESMRGPDDSLVRSINIFPPISQINGKGVRGLYWHFGVSGKMDHADEIGIFIEEDTAKLTREMYDNLAKIISRLLPQPGATPRLDQ